MRLRTVIATTFLVMMSTFVLVDSAAAQSAGQTDKPGVEFGTAVSADGVQIRYEFRGKGEPTLIFVHGWCCDRSYWREQLPYFAKKHRVVAIDLAGHGESGLNRKVWTLDAFGDDVAAVAAKLSLKQVVLIGHSMGGSVIVKAAPKIPGQVLGLVAVDQFFNLEEKHTQEEMDKFIAPFRVNFREAVSNWVRTVFTPKSDPKLVEWVVAHMSARPPEVGLGAATGADGELRVCVQHRQLPDTGTPESRGSSRIHQFGFTAHRGKDQ